MDIRRHKLISWKDGFDIKDGLGSSWRKVASKRTRRAEKNFAHKEIEWGLEDAEQEYFRRMQYECYFDNRMEFPCKSN